MTHWKQRLHQTHPVCKCKLRKLIQCILCVICIVCSSCSKKENESITLLEWIKILNTEAGITSYTETNPYFSSIDKDSTYYADVQAAVEWGVLEEAHPFLETQVLNKEWTAFTLVNLIGNAESSSIEIDDLSTTHFPSQVQTSIQNGLFTLDHKKQFHPAEVMDKETAIALLDKVVDTINHRQITETKTSITWKEDTQVVDVDPIAFQQDQQMIQIADDVQMNQGQLIHFYDDTNEYYYVVDHQDGQSLYLQDVDLMSYTKNMNLSGSSELNFDQATIEDNNGDIIQEYSSMNPISLCSTHALQKTFHVNDYNVVVTASSSSVKAEVNRTLPHGSKVYASVKLNGAKVDYQFSSKEKNIDDAYFKVKFSSEESLGLKNGSYKNLYGDFSKFDANDFLSSVQKMYVEKKDVVESTLELCKIKLPIPNAPLMNITVSLNLNMHVSGKVSLSLNQTSSIGCEIRNGNMRMIHEFDHSHSNQLKANVGMSSGLMFGLNLTSLRLMDASLNAGAEATFKTSLHLYQNDEYNVVETDVSTDVVDELADGNPNVLVCSDLSANTVIYLKMNSAKSQLGKIGFTKRINLLKQSMLPKGKTHLENFQFVSKCTRKEREKSTKLETLSVTKKIKLKEYSMVVHVSKAKAIQITGLPEGYTKDDLEYISSNEDVAKTDSNGNVIGKSAGSSVITVSTSDRKHYIKCNVIVSE